MKWQNLLYGLLIVTGWGTNSATLAANAPIRVSPEVYQPATTASRQAKPVPATTLHVNQPVRPRSVTLSVPPATALKALQNQSGSRRAFQIGFQRSIPDLPPVAEWTWTVTNQGQAGHFTITSLDAQRIRTLLLLEQPLPDGVEIRVYAPNLAEEVYGPYGNAQFLTLPGQTLPALWTPTLSGDTLGIEVFVPAGVDPEAVKLRVPQLSHIAYNMQSGQLKSTSLSGFKFASCDVSLACAPVEWQQTGQSVARYIFTDQTGSSYLCSGTLLADQDSSSQIPYFLTAAHCVYDETTSSSMEMYWFDQESSCGADDARPTHTTGGADLLVTRTDLDSSLLRLRTPPPAGVLMSGWALDDLSVGQAVHAIHHGLGNPKQYSQGSFLTHASLTPNSAGYLVVSDPTGDFNQVGWSQGITAPGSSGSGLWIKVDGQHYLKGTLVGGSSSCSAPDSPDEYSRLERFHPYASVWLDKTSAPLSSVLDSSQPASALMDGILVARYMSGVRGSNLLTGVVSSQSIDLTVLENHLELAQYQLDVDGDGLREAQVDGLLLARYLIGLRNNALIEGINLNGSPRNTASSLTAYLISVLN